MDKEKKDLELTKKDLASVNLSSKENNEYNDKGESEKLIGQSLNQSASDINLPSRNQNKNEPAVSGGGLNNLIRRMTGLGEKREQEDDIATKNKINEENEKLITDREDESKLEIPAFLRRQAN